MPEKSSGHKCKIRRLKMDKRLVLGLVIIAVGVFIAIFNKYFWLSGSN
jgi:hypothetical protein